MFMMAMAVKCYVDGAVDVDVKLVVIFTWMCTYS